MSVVFSDFSLTIEGADRRYQVRAFTPDAEAETATELPFRPEDLDGILSRIVTTATSSRNLGRIEVPVIPPGLKEIGRQLFRALFHGEVGELYAAHWNSETKAGHGVRIRLHLRPGKAGQAWLSRLPWELMYDDRAGIFPCLSPLNPLVRHLDLSRTAERLPFASPICVLVAAASPQGAAMLDLAGEQERMAFAGGTGVRVKVLEQASPLSLRQELLAGSYQILHFMGHGLVEKGGGGLLFTSTEASPLPVSGETLTHLVQGVSTLRLTILNACYSAAIPRGDGIDALAGVATALVKGGQTAVVGMQFPIQDRAAIVFSEALYGRLGAGLPIEAAVAEGRLAVWTELPEFPDWASPVLFLRGNDERTAPQEVEEPIAALARDSIEQTVEAAVIQGKEIGIIGEDCVGPSSTRPSDIKLKVISEQISGDQVVIAGRRSRGN